MTKDVDGNLHFLNKYMEEQDKYDGDIETEEVEFSGEELYDLLGGKGFNEGIVTLKELDNQYPNNYFDEAISYVKPYLKKKAEDSYGAEYGQLLSREYFGKLKHWIDTKWLAVNGKEEDILYSILEFVADVVYQEDSLSEIDFVEIVMLGEELASVLEDLEERGISLLKGSVSVERRKVVKEGLLQAGFNKEWLAVNTPTVVAKEFLRNTKTIGTRTKRLQLTDNQAQEGLKTLGIIKNSIDEYQDIYVACRIYSNVYKALYNTTQGKAYREVVNRVNVELKKRLELGANIRFSHYYFDDSGVVIYVTEKVFLIIGTQVSLYQRVQPDKRSLVVSKAVSDVRVKDIKAMVDKL